MLAAVFDLLRHRQFRLLFAGEALSYLGSALVPVALAFAVLDLTGSPADLGIVLMGRVIPYVLLVAAGGVLGDRMRRERLLLFTNLVAAAAQGLTATLLLTGRAEIWHLFALQFLLGGAGALTAPALFGLVSDTAPAHRLQEANALLSLVRSVTSVAGPALAGVIVVFATPGWALAVDAVSYALAAGAFLMLEPTPVPRASKARRFFRDMIEGWNEFRSRAWLWSGVLYLAFLHLFVIAPFLVLGPLVAKQSLGGAGAWAAIVTAGGVGSVLAGLLALRLKPARPLFASFVVCLGVAPQAALLALAAPLAAIAAAAFAAQLVLTFGSPLWNSVLQEQIPRAVYARVQAYDVIGSFALLPVGFGLSGVVAKAVGADTILWFSAVWIVLSTVAIASVPSIRGLRRAPSPLVPAAPGADSPHQVE